MAITMVDLRRELVGRAKELIVTAGMSATIDDINPDLDPALSWAAHEHAKAQTKKGNPTPPPDSLSLTDDYVGSKSLFAVYDLLAYAEYRLLATIRNRLIGVDQKVGMGEAKLSQLRDSIDRRLAVLAKDLGLDTGLQTFGTLNIKRNLYDTIPEAWE